MDEALDQFIVTDNLLLAIKTYRETSGRSINDAMEFVDRRKQELLAVYPERFKTEAEYRAEAYTRLRNVPSPILVIEGSWDGNSWGWFILLSAITEEPSPQHPKYSTYGLYAVRNLDHQVEQAIEFGTELANAAGVPFYLTDANTNHINYKKRWWDEHG